MCDLLFCKEENLTVMTFQQDETLLPGLVFYPGTSGTDFHIIDCSSHSSWCMMHLLGCS